MPLLLPKMSGKWDSKLVQARAVSEWHLYK